MDNSSSNIIDVFTKLIRSLECPVCYEYVSSPIWQCQSGHVLCNICKSSIHSCPTCREPYSPVRVRSLEYISELMLFPCKNDGCNEFLPLVKMTNHEMRCTRASANNFNDESSRVAFLQTTLLYHIEQHIAPFFINKSNTDRETQTVPDILPKVQKKDACTWTELKSNDGNPYPYSGDGEHLLASPAMFKDEPETSQNYTFKGIAVLNRSEKISSGSCVNAIGSDKNDSSSSMFPVLKPSKELTFDVNTSIGVQDIHCSSYNLSGNVNNNDFQIQGLKTESKPILFNFGPTFNFTSANKRSKIPEVQTLSSGKQCLSENENNQTDNLKENNDAYRTFLKPSYVASKSNNNFQKQSITIGPVEEKPIQSLCCTTANKSGDERNFPKGDPSPSFTFSRPADNKNVASSVGASSEKKADTVTFSNVSAPSSTVSAAAPLAPLVNVLKKPGCFWESDTCLVQNKKDSVFGAALGTKQQQEKRKSEPLSLKIPLRYSTQFGSADSSVTATSSNLSATSQPQFNFGKATANENKSFKSATPTHNELSGTLGALSLLGTSLKPSISEKTSKVPECETAKEKIFFSIGKSPRAHKTVSPFNKKDLLKHEKLDKSASCFSFSPFVNGECSPNISFTPSGTSHFIFGNSEIPRHDNSQNNSTDAPDCQNPPEITKFVFGDVKLGGNLFEGLPVNTERVSQVFEKAKTTPPFLPNSSKDFGPSISFSFSESSNSSNPFARGPSTSFKISKSGF